jgi:hypothetical protein
MSDIKVVMPPLPLLVPLDEPTDPWDEARHMWKKGRLEFMGGPIVYEQGNETDPNFFGETLEDQNRACKYPPIGLTKDPYAHELGVDDTEQ